MADVPVYTNAPRIILDTLRNELDAHFKSFWHGDPVAIGKSQLPALMIDWEQSSPMAAPTGHDKWQHSIVVKVLVNKMDDVSTLDMAGKGVTVDVPTRQRLEKLIFARNGTTKQYLPDTVMGVLRRQFTMGSTISDQVTSIDYGISQRPNGRAATVITAEAHLRLLVTELIQVSGRT